MTQQSRDRPTCDGGANSVAPSLTPCQREYIEKLVLTDAAEIAKDLLVERIIAVALSYPFGVVKRKPAQKD